MNNDSIGATRHDATILLVDRRGTRSRNPVTVTMRRSFAFCRTRQRAETLSRRLCIVTNGFFLPVTMLGNLVYGNSVVRGKRGKLMEF